MPSVTISWTGAQLTNAIQALAVSKNFPGTAAGVQAMILNDLKGQIKIRQRPTAPTQAEIDSADATADTLLTSLT